METKEHRPKADAYKQVYVLRIYRRGEDPPGSLAGVVEKVSTGVSTPFRTGEELLSLLSGEGRH